MKILIVDDQSAAREMVRSTLAQVCMDRDLEAEIETVESGLLALKHLTQNDVTVLVCDLHMPDLTGMDVLKFWAERLEEREGHGVAVVASTMASARDKEKAMALGAIGVWEKPITVEQCQTLLQAATKALG